MKREELKICLAIDATAFYDNNEEMYAKAEADSVMDEMEMTLACYEDEVHQLRKQLEDVQNAMATENVDLGMENHKLKERIKELEYKLRDKGGKNAELQATNSDLRKRIKELEAEKERLRKEKRTALDDVLVCRRVIMENEDVMEEQKDVISKLETTLQNAVDGGNIAMDVAKRLESSQPKWIGLDIAKGNDFTYVYQPPKSDDLLTSANHKSEVK